jgi:hypothetical protein
LTKSEREELMAMTRKGKSNAAKFVHMRALLLCDAGEHGKSWKATDVTDDWPKTCRVDDSRDSLNNDCAKGAKKRIAPYKSKTHQPHDTSNQTVN